MKSLAVQREKCEDRLRRGSLCTLQGETEAARSPTHSEKLGFGRRAELFCSSWTGLKLRGTISMATSKLQSCLPIFRTCWPSRGGHQVHQMEPGEGRMKLLGAVLLGAVLLSSPAQLSKPEEQPQVCYFDVLSGRDSRFCRGELQVIYPDVGDVSCIYMPKCHQYRWRIIRDWMRPRVRFPQADENKKYVLVLADPDTPSREKPWNQYWRHWLVADIPEPVGADPRAIAQRVQLWRDPREPDGFLGAHQHHDDKRWGLLHVLYNAGPSCSGEHFPTWRNLYGRPPFS
nr:phosphatidylethanolamine-binding protein 4 isoform X4 [Columba livia]